MLTEFKDYLLTVVGFVNLFFKFIFQYQPGLVFWGFFFFNSSYLQIIYACFLFLEILQGFLHGEG